MSCRINGALTKDKSAAMDIIRVDHSGIGQSKVTDFEQILLWQAGGVQKTLEVKVN